MEVHAQEGWIIWKKEARVEERKGGGVDEFIPAAPAILKYCLCSLFGKERMDGRENEGKFDIRILLAINTSSFV